MIIFKDLEVLKEAIDKGFEISEVQLPYPASRVMIKQLDAYYSTEEI